MSDERMPMSELHRAEWLADKIPAYGDYAKEAAELLRRYAKLLGSGARPEVEARNAIIEECAKVCDRLGQAPDASAEGYEGNCALAIRELLSPPQGER